MVTITVMLIKTIFDRREVNLIPDVSQALALAGKTSSGVKGGYSVGWSAKLCVLMLMAHWQQQVILKH